MARLRINAMTPQTPTQSHLGGRLQFQGLFQHLHGLFVFTLVWQELRNDYYFYYKQILKTPKSQQRTEKSHSKAMPRIGLPGQACAACNMAADSSPFPSCTRPWHCSAPGWERPGWCSAPLRIAPAWAGRQPGCSDTWLCTPAPPLPHLPSRHHPHLYRTITQPGRTFVFFLFIFFFNCNWRVVGSCWAFGFTSVCLL